MPRPRTGVEANAVRAYRTCLRHVNGPYFPMLFGRVRDLSKAAPLAVILGPFGGVHPERSEWAQGELRKESRADQIGCTRSIAALRMAWGKAGCPDAVPMCTTHLRHRPRTGTTVFGAGLTSALWSSGDLLASRPLCRVTRRGPIQNGSGLAHDV